MSEIAEKSMEERLNDALLKLDLLERAAWEMLVALETQEDEHILTARQRLRSVFLDL
jgi:hypothetical protein